MENDLLKSEYNNVGELYGIDAVTKQIQNSSQVARAMLLKKLSQKNQAPKNSREIMEMYFAQLPSHIVDGLRTGRLRLADYTIYSTKAITSKTIKMFESQDDKEVGIRNISNAKLPKNMVMAVRGIYLLAGIRPDEPVVESHKIVKFGSIGGFEALANGEFNFKANKKQIIPENQSNRRFITDNDVSVPLGYYKLDNPRLILDEEAFEFTVELGTMAGITDKHYLYVGLDGTITTP